jgi:predicted RNase H-like HicB family nuclease
LIEYTAYIKDCGSIWVVDFKEIGVYTTVQAKSLREVLKKAKEILKESIYYFDIKDTIPSRVSIDNNKNLFSIKV